MEGGRAIAASLVFRPPPDRAPVIRDRFVSRYPAPTLTPGRSLEPDNTQQGPRLIRVTWAVAAAALVGLITSFAMHLVNLRMQNLGISGSLISLSVAVQALAICVSALAAKRVIARFGLQQILPFSALVCALTLVGVFYGSNFFLLCALRFVFAAALSFLLVASEYLVTVRSKETNCTTIIAWYTTAIGAGTIVGPLLINVFEVNELSSFLLGVSMLMFGALLLSGCLSPSEGKTSRRTSCYSLVAFMPAAFMAALVFGIADNGGLSMLSVYGANNHYDNASAANLAVFAAIGGMMLQFPIVWLATKRSTTELLLTFSILVLGLLASLPFAISNKPMAFLVAAGLGGLIEGFYTLGLICISRDRRTSDMTSLNACFISMCSLGEVVGPAASSVSMYNFGSSGFVIALAIAFALYALALVNRLGFESKTRNTFN